MSVIKGRDAIAHKCCSDEQLPDAVPMARDAPCITSLLLEGSVKSERA
jgi:hypothetical protein